MTTFQFTLSSKLFKVLDSSYSGILLFYLLGTALMWSSEGSSFTDDSLEWLVFFQKNGWDGFWHSYEMTSIFYLHDLFSNLMYILFGKNNMAWFLIILFFHTTAAYFLYRFLFTISSQIKLNNPFFFSITASFLFLTSAYHTECLYWIATYHYCISALYLCYSLYLIAVQKGDLSIVEYVKIFVPFPFMVTMHEIVFFFPFCFMVLILFYQLTMRVSDIPWRKWILWYSPFFVASSLILFLTYKIKGSFVPHYGHGHLENHSVFGFVSTLFSYCEKYFAFVHNMPFHWREKFYDINSTTLTVFFNFCLIVIGVFFYFKRRVFHNYKLAILLIVLLLILFIPVSNMYFFWHFPFQNDRLGYFFSLFAYPIFCLLLLLIHQQIGSRFVLVFLIINFVFLRLNVCKINEASQYYHKILIPSYKKYIDQKPLILNLPYNYNGVYIFRHKLRFLSATHFFYGKDHDYTYTTSSPFFSKTDSIIAIKISDTQFHISLAAPGSWLMNEAMGGSDYESSELKVDYSDDNQSATIYLKEPVGSRPVLYCTAARGFVPVLRSSK